MKEVMAFIRINRMNETKAALAKAGFSSFTASGRVHGRGKGLVDRRLLQAAEEGNEYATALLGEGPRLMSKRMLYLMVPDSKVKLAVDTIIDANQTGKAGDGKIFVMPAIESIRVRTGEKGDKVLD